MLPSSIRAAFFAAPPCAGSPLVCPQRTDKVVRGYATVLATVNMSFAYSVYWRYMGELEKTSRHNYGDGSVPAPFNRFFFWYAMFCWARSFVLAFAHLHFAALGRNVSSPVDGEPKACCACVPNLRRP
jgi:hypothetical protein